MAQRTQVILEDDLDGGPADETIRFGLDGSAYEIDLSKKNAKAMRDDLAKWVGAARKAGRGGGRGGTRRGSRGDRARLQEIRVWARSKGHQVADRGRVPAHLIEEYDRTH